MEVLLVTLVVPTVGALMLLAEWQGRTAIGSRTRRNWRHVLCVAGLALFPIAAGVAFYAVLRFLELGGEQSLLLISRLLLIGVIVWAGRRAVQVARSGDERELTAREAVMRSRPSDELRIAAATMIGFPLFGLAMMAMVFIAPLLYVMGVAATTRRAEVGRLLWSLAIAVEHRLNLADEVEALAFASGVTRRNRLLTLVDRLRDGSRLSEALQADPRLLPSSVVAAIRIGEQTGRLGPVLRDCAMRDTTSMRHSQADGGIAALMSYYWVLSVVMVIVITGLCYWIVPKLKEIFSDFGIELPPITVRMIRFADWVVDFWYLLPFLALPVTLILLMAYAYLISWDRLNLPLLMRWFPRRDAPGVLRSFAWAVDAGQPLPELVIDAGEHHPRPDLGKRLVRIGQVMAGGEDTWMSLADEGFLTGREARALEAAGRARHLPMALGAMADSIDRARRHRLLWWIEWCKPIVILMFGWLVALYCAAFFLPIVQLVSYSYE